METPTWQKNEMVCSCGCGRKFKPAYRNGILISKLHPNCRLKSLHKEMKPKGVCFATEMTKKATEQKKRGKTERQKAMTNADTWFSRYVRIINRVSAVNGEVICRDIITGRLYAANKIDCGHFWSRDCKATRFDPNNCRPQNKGSNQYRGEADKDTFADNLRSEIGDDEFQRIEQLHRKPVNDSTEWYKEKADYFRRLVNSEIKKYGLNKWW